MDRNDNPPTFIDGDYSATVPETLGVGSTVLTLSAEDADSSSSENVQFTIVSGNVGDQFRIVTDEVTLTGIVQVAKVMKPRVSFREKISPDSLLINNCIFTFVSEFAGGGGSVAERLRHWTLMLKVSESKSPHFGGCFVSFGKDT